MKKPTYKDLVKIINRLYESRNFAQVCYLFDCEKERLDPILDKEDQCTEITKN